MFAMPGLIGKDEERVVDFEGDFDFETGERDFYVGDFAVKVLGRVDAPSFSAAMR